MVFDQYDSGNLSTLTSGISLDLIRGQHASRVDKINTSPKALINTPRLAALELSPMMVVL